MTRSRNNLIAGIALMTALALIFSYIEAILPFNIGIPGVKLGIANIVVVLALYIFDWKVAFTINTLRIILAGLLFSGVFGIIYSFAGGVLSLFIMVMLKKTEKFSIIGICTAAGVAHNLGQIITAAILIENIKMFAYFPVLIFSGIVMGILTGTVAYILLGKLPKSITQNISR